MTPDISKTMQARANIHPGNILIASNPIFIPVTMGKRVEDDVTLANSAQADYLTQSAVAIVMDAIELAWHSS